MLPKNMKTQSLKSIRYLFCLSLAPLWLAGCASGPDIKRVDATSQRGLQTEGITIREFQEAAEMMVNSLNNSIINAGRLQAPPGKQAMLAVSRIVNNTTLHIDTDLLTFPITAKLNETGKIEVVVTDKKAKDAAAADRFRRDDKSLSRLPDYTLSGKIVEQRDIAGDKRQTSFVFQMSLNSTTSDGATIWQKQEIISKERTRRTLGL